MKSKVICVGIGLFVNATLGTAASITVPDGSFQNVTGAIYAPTAGLITGPATGNIGTWSVEYYDTTALGGYMECSNVVTAGWPAPPSGQNELQINMPTGVNASCSISESLSTPLQPDSTYTLTMAVDSTGTINLLGSSTLSLYLVGSSNLVSTIKFLGRRFEQLFGLSNGIAYI